MKLPFVSRKTHEALQESHDDAAAHYDQAYELIEELRREITQLKADGSAAQCIADAISDLAAAHTANSQTLATAAERIAHATGANATATHKAADVQREWLEISKGNR